MVAQRVHYAVGGYGGGAPGSTSITAITLDSSADKSAGMFVAPDASQPIVAIGIFLPTVTGIQPTYRVVIQGYQASGGEPDGVDAGGGSPTATTFVPSSTGYLEVTLGNSFTPVAGTAYAVVIEYDSGTIGVGNFSAFNRSWNPSGVNATPYVLEDLTGSWAKVTAGLPTLSVIYADGFIVPGTECCLAVDNTNYNVNSTPDEFGNLWVPERDGVVTGFRNLVRMNSANANWELVFYNSSDTELVVIPMDGEQRGSTSTFKWGLWGCEAINVVGGDSYRLTMKATSTTGTRKYVTEWANAAHRESYAGSLQLTSRVNEGSWTEEDDKVMATVPMLADVSTGGRLWDLAPR